LIQETIDLRIRNCVGGALAAKSGMFIEHAMAVAETESHNREEAASMSERFADGMTPEFLDWRAEQYCRRNPEPPAYSPEWYAWKADYQRAKRRNFERMQELVDCNGGDPVDHGSFIPELDA
jgi:hypothetical protein